MKSYLDDRSTIRARNRNRKSHLHKEIMTKSRKIRKTDRGINEIGEGDIFRAPPNSNRTET